MSVSQIGNTLEYHLFVYTISCKIRQSLVKENVSTDSDTDENDW